MAKAFIAMPSHSKLEWLSEIIAETCAFCRVEPRNVNKLAGIAGTWEAIVKEIKACDIFIAAFSPAPSFDKDCLEDAALRQSANTDVAAETGYAKALGKPVILLTSDTESLPLDWKAKPAIIYPTERGDANGIIAVRERLTHSLQTELRLVEVTGLEKVVSRDSKYPALSGFTFVGERSYTCGEITNVVAEYRHGRTDVEFVLVPGGTFDMGSDSGDKDETPVHEVVISPYLISKHQVRQVVWEKVMGENPSHFKGADRPVEMVSWEDCRKFCKKTELQLPTEAQWEYACQSGSKGKYCFGNDESMLDGYAWYNKNSGSETHPVGQKMANAFGLCDMHGNIWEWCEDDWHDNYRGAPKDGRAWIDNPRSSRRVRRGGGFDHEVGFCRSAFRGYFAPVYRGSRLGFRLAAGTF